MPLKIEFTQHRGYIHAVVEGENCPENVLAYAARIQAECEAKRCYRVLVEECLSGPRLDTIQILRLARAIGSKMGGFFKSVAYVDRVGMGELLRFAEDAATNRGFHMKAFAAVPEAAGWLEAEADKDTEKGV